ncbi:hypothetical protein GGF37_004224, partial [Kickxella alabastrina]
RDRRHLTNARILGWKGISHPGLTWHYDHELNAMTCLGYSCPIYTEFNPTAHNQNSCLSVHRSCYTLLAEQLERIEGSLGSCNLLQRLSPHIDSRGILSMDKCRKIKKQRSRMNFHLSHTNTATTATTATITNTAMAWSMCDPTDLPNIDILSPRSEAMGLSPVRFADTESKMYMAEKHTISQQLLTPPMSPMNTSMEQFDIAPIFTLLTLPVPILLGIFSYLQFHEILALSQSCSVLRRYFSAESQVWSQMCQSTLKFTPKLLHNRQLAEYYLRVRGNERMETKVLVQRKHVEKVIQQFMHSKLVK